MKLIYRPIALVGISALVASLGVVACATTAEATPSHSTPTSISASVLNTARANNSTVAAEIDALVGAVDQRSMTFDERLVSLPILHSVAGAAFAEEFARAGGTTIHADGEMTPGAPQSRAAKGRIWSDIWGAHMTMPSGAIDRLSALAATGSGAAGAIAAFLAVNIEGFPISTAGALAAGAVAVALIGIAGALQFCNIHGKGAQVNYNWITWTCWPL